MNNSQNIQNIQHCWPMDIDTPPPHVVHYDRYGPQPATWLGPSFCFNYTTARPCTFEVVAAPPNTKINK